MFAGDFNKPSQVLLRFHCSGCGHALEAPLAFAGVTGPCPLCATPVQAPLEPVTTLVELPDGFWDEPVPPPPLQQPVPVDSPLRVGPLGLPVKSQSWERLPDLEVPVSMAVTRDEEEAHAVASHRRKRLYLHVFDAILFLLLIGTLVFGGAALAFTEPKPNAVPQGPPELSRLVVERMQQRDEQRHQSLQAARSALAGLAGAANQQEAAAWLMPGGGEMDFPLFPGVVPSDFEFIQARRLPGTNRFLSLFEIAADSPLVIPVEETEAGSLIHGQALMQQMRGRLSKFLATQGQGEEVFYVLLRPGPAPMVADYLQKRPDLKEFELVAVEPAFPADGTSSCLVCVNRDSPPAVVFARRAHDSGLRPAVVRLGWRQHRESGTFVELLSFIPNAWSRH